MAKPVGVVYQCDEGHRWIIRNESAFQEGHSWRDDMLGMVAGREIGEVDFIRKQASKHSIFIDIGAHVGYFSIRLAMDFERVYAIEANPRIAVALKINILLNGIDNIIVFNNGLSASKGYGKIFDRGGCSQLVNLGDPQIVKHLAILHKIKDTRKIWVETLDNLIDCMRPFESAFIKVDTEGAELDILEGAKKTLSLPTTWMIEHHSYVYAGLENRVHEISELMIHAGHRCIGKMREDEPPEQKIIFSNMESGGVI